MLVGILKVFKEFATSERHTGSDLMHLEAVK